jgi:hypothetical protein
MREVVFVDKTKAPGDVELDAALGRSRAAWKKLREFLMDNYGLAGEWVYYGRKAGWVLRYRKGGKALTTLSPFRGYFNVQIVLGRADYEQAREADLSEGMRAAIESARAYHDGRWLFPEVKTLKDLGDIITLLLIKRKPAKKKT